MNRVRDSIRAVYIDIAALKNPIIRQAGISFETFGAGKVTSRLNGEPLLRGRLQASRITAGFSVPLAAFGKNRLSANFAARYQHLDLYDVETNHPDYALTDMKLDKYTAGGSLALTRLDTLFNRPAVLSGTASFLIDPETGQNRFTFSALTAITVKQTRKTSISLGLIVLIDPMAPLPVIPFIRYYHQFNPRLELFFDPSRVALRKELSAKHFLWITNDIAGNFALFQLNNKDMPRKAAYSTLEIKSGIIYEYRATRKIVLAINAGISTTAQSRMLDQNKNKDPFIVNKQNIVPYAQVSISCLPFWKGFVR
jgi:hypothetical protein